jgi:CAAX protease family protein
MMLRALRIRGLWQAVIISSLFFGIVHLLNAAAGANLAATLLQVVYAVAIGLMYAALALRTQTILPLIVTHGLTDFFGFLAFNATIVTTGFSTLVFIVTAGEIIVYTVYSIILMRQMKAQAFGAETGTTSMPPLAHED